MITILGTNRSIITLKLSGQNTTIKDTVSAIRVTSSTYMRLLIFLQAMLIPGYDSPACHFL